MKKNPHSMEKVGVSENSRLTPNKCQLCLSQRNIQELKVNRNLPFQRLYEGTSPNKDRDSEGSRSRSERVHRRLVLECRADAGAVHCVGSAVVLPGGTRWRHDDDNRRHTAAPQSATSMADAVVTLLD